MVFQVVSLNFFSNRHEAKRLMLVLHASLCLLIKKQSGLFLGTLRNEGDGNNLYLWKTCKMVSLDWDMGMGLDADY